LKGTCDSDPRRPPGLWHSLMCMGRMGERVSVLPPASLRRRKADGPPGPPHLRFEPWRLTVSSVRFQVTSLHFWRICLRRFPVRILKVRGLQVAGYAGVLEWPGPGPGHLVTTVCVRPRSHVISSLTEIRSNTCSMLAIPVRGSQPLKFGRNPPTILRERIGSSGHGD
jgi:hypothetical protein